MIENFLVYSFGKLVNCTVWNWICTASDKFSFFLFFLFSPGSKRSKSRAMRADVSFVTVCCAHCNSSRSNQNLGSTVTTSASRVVFSRLMNGKKKTRNLKGQTGVVQNLLYTIDFSIHSFFERKLQYIYDHVFTVNHLFLAST